MIPRSDLQAEEATHCEVVQLTSGPLPSSHLYMEAQIFTPDSSRFLLHESATAHGSDKDDPRHRYLVCDLDDNCALRPLTEEVGATAPSVAPDGRYVYYFVDETQVNGGRLSLRRVRLDGTERQSISRIATFASKRLTFWRRRRHQSRKNLLPSSSISGPRIRRFGCRNPTKRCFHQKRSICLPM